MIAKSVLLYCDNVTMTLKILILGVPELPPTAQTGSFNEKYFCKLLLLISRSYDSLKWIKNMIWQKLSFCLFVNTVDVDQQQGNRTGCQNIDTLNSPNKPKAKEEGNVYFMAMD